MKSINEYLQHTRHQYDRGILAENHLDPDPLNQFMIWMQEAIHGGVPEPNAMDLCTWSEESGPTCRITLLKGVEEQGFVFYTNYDSRKGKEMAEYPQVCLNFFWQQMFRQVRIEGKIEKVSPAASDEYFSTRPRESQIGAWASSQSAVIHSRAELEERIRLVEKEFEGKAVPRPPHWGGYLVIPQRIEFWQGRPNRLHDRFLYDKGPEGWMVFRLSP